MPRRPAGRRPLGRTISTLLVGGLLVVWPLAAHAQYIQQYFPSGVPGYENQPGVTVANRLRTPYDPLGVHVGDFLVNSDLAESVGYNSNVAGFANSPGSGFIETAPSLSINSDWTRDRLGAAFTTDSKKYFSTPLQDTNDWTATLGGGYTIGREQLVAGYSHLSLHEQPNEIGTSLSATPIPYTVDDARIFYTFDQGRFSFIPRVDVQLYQYGDATLVNVPGVTSFNNCGSSTAPTATNTAGLAAVSQRCDNRVVSTGSLQTRYALTDQNSLVFVLEGVKARYMNVPDGQPTSNSQSLIALGGLDYQADGLWRYTVLAGIERRTFEAAQFPVRTAPIVEATVVWTPTGLTTVTGLLSRTIENPNEIGTAGYTYTTGSVTVDHEYLRNVLLQAKAQFQSADYLQSNTTQTSYTFGTGAQWLLSQHVRLALNYTFTQQSGVNESTILLPNAALGGFQRGNYKQNLVLLTLRLSL